jgi:hypothetical protein
MKTVSTVGGPAQAIAVGIVALAAVLAVAPRLTAATPDAAPGEPKTHTLFMGADVLIEQDKVFYRVQDVEGGSFLIKVKGKVVKIPANWGAIKLKVDRSLKLTGTSVAVDHLLVDRTYTPGHDPVKRFMHEQGEEMARADKVADLTVQLEQAKIMTRVGGGVIIPGLTGDPGLIERKLSQMQGASLADFGNSAGTVGRMQDALGQELYDAIDVEFDVSAGTIVRKPFIVVMAQFHAPEAKPDESQNWLYAAELDPLNAKPQKVRIRMGGFPPGFVVEKYQVHVYDGGQELASTVAEKQVPLTRNEAFAYLLLDYFGSHKGATLPATAVLGRLDPATKARLDPELLRRSYFVKVSKDGRPLAAFVDANLAIRADEPVASLVGDVRFLPALENGQPVEGVAELKFSRLAL